MAQVKVKLDELIDAIEMTGHETAAYLDTLTGRVELITDDTRYALRAGRPGDELPDWQRPLVEMGRLIDAEEEALIDAPDDAARRFLPLPARFDVHEWRVMMEFAEGLDDAEQSRALSNALRGSGAFRRFKDTAHRLGVIDAWHAARDEAYRQEAIDWCAAHGVVCE